MKHRCLILNGIVAICMALCTGSVWSSEIPTHQLVVARVAAGPVMDGKLDDAAWSQAAETGRFTVVGFKNKKAAAPTYVKAVTDGMALYFGFRCVEPRVSEIPVRPQAYDTDTWLQDSLEVVLDPVGDRKVCYHIIANISGGGYESRLTVDPLGLVQEDSAWNGDMVVSASKGHGEWCAEIKIPFSTFGIDPSTSPVAGVNFNRKRLVGGEELSCWSPNRVTFPELTDLGDLVLSGADGSYCQVRFPEPVSITVVSPQISFQVSNHLDTPIRPKVVYRNAGPHSSSGELRLGTIAPGKELSATLSLAGITEGSYKFDAKVVDAISGRDLFLIHRDLEVSAPIVFNESLYALYHKRVDAVIDVRVPTTDEKLKISLLKSGSETPIACKTFDGPFAKPVKASFTLASQTQGTYRLQGELLRGDESVFSAQSRNYPYKPDPKVGFSDDGDLIVDGKSFFPIGIYTLCSQRLEPDDAAMHDAKSAGFNSAMIYVEDPRILMPLLDGLDRYGLKAFIVPTRAFSRGAVKDVLEEARHDIDIRKDHPAIIAWYVIDEPEGQGWIPPKSVREMYQTIKERDQDHPCWTVIMSPESAKGYGPCTDIVGLDPYPLPKQPITTISDYVSRSIANMETGKPLWNIPQAFDWSVFNNGKVDGEHCPNAAEDRCLTYLALVNGAKGIVYWTFYGPNYYMPDYPERWASLKRVASEVRDLSPVLMTPTVDGKLTIRQAGSSIQTMVKRMGNSWYVLTVNSARTPCTGGFGLSGVKDSSLEVLFEKRSLQAKNGKWTDEFKPLEVHVYRIIQK